MHIGHLSATLQLLTGVLQLQASYCVMSKLHQIILI